MPDSSPTVKLGRYELHSRLATGGMATVYRASLEGRGGFAREVALKVIHPHLCELPGFTERFLDEARVASRIRHPNVVSTTDVGEYDGYRYLVLELIDGLTLRQLLELRQRPLPAMEAARLLADAARGLAALHDASDASGQRLDPIHRDISPHNIMLDAEGRSVLIDLGLAKAKGQLGHTETGVLCGKLPYMSPEQSELKELDARSDIFSLGSVLFELAVGRAPFGEDHTPGTLARLRKCDSEPLRAAMEQPEPSPNGAVGPAPEWFVEIVLACLQPRAEDRFPDAGALADALEEGLRSESANAARTRARLAAIVADARARQPAPARVERLAPTITTNAVPNLGNRPPLPFSGRRTAIAAITLSVAAAAALVWSFTEGSPATAIGSDQEARGSMAADTLRPGAATKPATAKRAPNPRAPAEPASEPPVEEISDTEGATGEPETAELEPKARKSPRRKKKREPLRSNPYAG